MRIPGILKSIGTLIAQVTKKNCQVSAAENLGLKMEELTEDIVQISQNKVFKPQETIEEAAKYAKDVLGIEEFNMQNLDMANYTLDGFTKIKQIINTDIGIKKVLSKKSITDSISGKPNPCITGRIDPVNGEITLSENAMRTDLVSKLSLIVQMDPKNMNEYMKMMLDIEKSSVPLCEIMKRFKNLGYIPRSIDELPNQTVIHEIWHRLHYLNCKKLGIDYWKLGKTEELVACNIKDTSMLDEFLSPKIQKIISDYKFIGSYALTSPCEFVAEVGSIIANGIKPPPNIMELYYKYGGPKVNMQLL